MADTKSQPIDYSDGPIHTHFGLTYSSYEVVPRVLAQSMPHEWQERFVQCMEELDEAFAHIETPSQYRVEPAEDCAVGCLSSVDRALAGVVAEEINAATHVYTFTDWTGRELKSEDRVLVPVPDPLPPYSRGRTRVPRADQRHRCSNCDGVDPASCLFNADKGSRS